YVRSLLFPLLHFELKLRYNLGPIDTEEKFNSLEAALLKRNANKEALIELFKIVGRTREDPLLRSILGDPGRITNHLYHQTHKTEAEYFQSLQHLEDIQRFLRLLNPKKFVRLADDQEDLAAEIIKILAKIYGEVGENMEKILDNGE
ncbi:MAG: hypothetical protein WCJ84_04825, partial [Candidatus Peregrinibacteria bacterium]